MDGRTTWQQARPAFDLIAARYGSLKELSRADPEDLHDVLRPLGLWRRRRAVSLVRLAARWLEVGPAHVKIQFLLGCGKYTADSWAILWRGGPTSTRRTASSPGTSTGSYRRSNHATRPDRQHHPARGLRGHPAVQHGY